MPWCGAGRDDRARSPCAGIGLERGGARGRRGGEHRGVNGGWRRIAARLRWRPGVTLAATLSLTVVVSLTLVPGEEQHSDGLSGCIPQSLGDLAEHLHDTGGGPVALGLNALLVVPFTAALVWAGAWARTAVLVALALPVTVEVLQTVVPGRVCSVADIAVNVTGALAGAALAGGALRRRRSVMRESTPSAER